MTINITPEVTAAVEDAKQTLDVANAYVVDSTDMYNLAADELKAIKAKRTALEDQRLGMTRPLDASKKAIMDFFRQPIDWLTDAESQVKKAMLTYKQEQDRKEAAERIRMEEERQRRIAEAVAANPEAPPPVVIAPPPTTPPAPKVAGISTRQVWKYRVTDPAAVPREYLVIDDQKLGAMARATKGSVPVSGIEFYSEEVMAARA